MKENATHQRGWATGWYWTEGLGMGTPPSRVLPGLVAGIPLTATSPKYTASHFRRTWEGLNEY